ncbi:hypothetical protein ABBQ32_001828 [Trebouxia sp. C0010 RCD-2024]
MQDDGDEDEMEMEMESKGVDLERGHRARAHLRQSTREGKLSKLNTMSDDGQGSATSTNADVMGEVLQGSDVANAKATVRQHSVDDASMIAQAGDTAQLTGKAGALLSGSPNTSLSDQDEAETPNEQPDHLDSSQSPQKVMPESLSGSLTQGHAKQDLNGKLDDAAQGEMSQTNGIGSPTDTEQESSTVRTPAGKEASTTEPYVDTPASALANGSSPIPDNASPAAETQPAGSDSSSADADAVSVKQLIQRRSPSGTSEASSKPSSTPPVRRRTKDELPEGIRALKNRFSSASPGSSTPAPQPSSLPKDGNHQGPSPVHLEVEHKPGSKFWPYKELKELRIENGIDPTCKEEYLSEDEFSQVFKKWDLNLAQFKAQPVWRQRMQKQTVGLF